MILGVISDTHGWLRPEAVEALRGCEVILHAGDVGDPAILRKLEEIAPVKAVRGNVDREPWARTLPATESFEMEGVSIFMLHILEDLDLNPRAAGFGVVISGHSHKPAQDRKDGVLYFNPGSAGPRRFRLPVTVGRLKVSAGAVEGEILELKV